MAAYGNPMAEKWKQLFDPRARTATPPCPCRRTKNWGSARA